REPARSQAPVLRVDGRVGGGSGVLEKEPAVVAVPVSHAPVKPKARHRQRRKQRLVNRALDLGGLPRAELCDHVRVTGTGALEQVARSLAKPFARLQVMYTPRRCAVQREPCLDRGVLRQMLPGAVASGGPSRAKEARLRSARAS